MAKVVLHGGFKGLNTIQLESAWQRFFETIEPPENADVLILPWATPAKRHQQIESSFLKRAQKYWHVKISAIQILSSSSALDGYFDKKPQNRATLMYLPGGILGDKAVAEMQKVLPKRNAVLAQKNITFAGVSAGAYALMAFYYHPRRKKILPGGGLVKGCVCCHADDKRRQNVRAINTPDFEPLYMLSDGHFEVIAAHRGACEVPAAP